MFELNFVLGIIYMVNENMLENKKVFVLGMARSGYEVSKLIASNNDVLITDAKEQNVDHVEELKNLGVKYVVSDTPEDMLDESFDLVIKNPGITYKHPVCVKAKDLGISVVNEVEVAYNYLPKDITIVGVTGSNGKTTTVSLIYEMLLKENKKVHLAGNIGFPLSSFVSKIKSGDILVIEVSSHQLVDFDKFKTDISIVTNLTPTHLDFFDTYENYVDKKFRIFNHHTSDDIAIINLEDDLTVEYTKNIPSKRRIFTSQNRGHIYLEEDEIYYGDELFINTKDIKLKGVHNYENVMAAILAVKNLGVSDETIKSVLKDFSGVEHRIEFVKTINDIDFYNDSKSTNPISTKVALRAFDKPVILLLGGKDRGNNFDELKEDLKNVKNIICYGETKDIIEKFASDNNIPCTKEDVLEQAIIKAYELSNSGDVILFSPACASWDQYNSFEERGGEFKRVVDSLK